MTRLMAVSLTEPQVRAREKTVTRRVGWLNLTPGTRLTLCRKVMGRRKGDHVEPLVKIVEVEVVDVRRERLNAIAREPEGCTKEGFPEWEASPGHFIDFFNRTHKGTSPRSEITRIEFRYLDEP